MIPFDIMQSLLQSETRNQGVVVTIRDMKRVKTTFGYLHEGGWGNTLQEHPMLAGRWTEVVQLGYLQMTLPVVVSRRIEWIKLVQHNKV